MNADEPKPKGLGAEYGAQFQDASIVRAYPLRQPYPPETFSILKRIACADAPRVLDLGSGSGDLTIGLSELASAVDAVDASKEMIEAAKARVLPRDNVRWVHGAAEQSPLTGPYDLVTAGESLHWMDWPALFTRLKPELKRGHYLAVVGRSYGRRDWWDARFQAIVDRYTTNRDYTRYDLVAELERRGFFVAQGAESTAVFPFKQTVEALVEAFHSRNGFSRERMTATAAKAFDEEATEHLRAFADAGVLDLGAVGHVTWGTLP